MASTTRALRALLEQHARQVLSRPLEARRALDPFTAWAALPPRESTPASWGVPAPAGSWHYVVLGRLRADSASGAWSFRTVLRVYTSLRLGERALLGGNVLTLQAALDWRGSLAPHALAPSLRPRLVEILELALRLDRELALAAQGQRPIQVQPTWPHFWCALLAPPLPEDPNYSGQRPLPHPGPLVLGKALWPLLRACSLPGAPSPSCCRAPRATLVCWEQTAQQIMLLLRPESGPEYALTLPPCVVFHRPLEEGQPLPAGRPWLDLFPRRHYPHYQGLKQDLGEANLLWVGLLLLQERVVRESSTAGVSWLVPCQYLETLPAEGLLREDVRPLLQGEPVLRPRGEGEEELGEELCYRLGIQVVRSTSALRLIHRQGCVHYDLHSLDAARLQGVFGKDHQLFRPEGVTR